MTGAVALDVSQGPLADKAVARGSALSLELLRDSHFVLIVRWVYTARLVCIAVAAPVAVLHGSALAVCSLLLLTVATVLWSRSGRLLRWMIIHPLLGSLDVVLSVVVLLGVSNAQPWTLTAVCSALGAGLLFPRKLVWVLVLPLALAAVWAPTLLAGAPNWQDWLTAIAGLPVLVVGVALVGAVIRQSTLARVAAQDEVAQTLAAIGAAEERARLAREMHDSVGKSLHGISLTAYALRRAVDLQPELLPELADGLASASQTAAAEARRLLVALRHDQHDRPTVEVVEERLRHWSGRTGVPARLNQIAAVDADARVTRELVLSLDEMLHNIEKHAHATAVRVALRGGPDEIELEVADDGVGFDPAVLADREREGHFGQRGLRERAEALGGSATITSRPGAGTTVCWKARRRP
ncbi:MAG: ATP-binding protein [Microlunatus sp.]|nr:ATP-binding protein [Microlunatus sp.]